MNKKGIWIVVIVIAVLAVVAGILVWNHKVAKAPEVSSTTTPMSTSTVQQATSTASSSGGLTVTFSTSTTWGKYSGSSFSLSYPDSWTISPSPFFSMTNFAGKYEADATIPVGGAEIDIVTSTLYSSVNEVMTTELMSAIKVTTSTVTIDNVTCQKASYQNTYGSGIASQDISFYCLRGTELWKIYLSYRAGDPAAQMHISDFNGVLNSIKFLP